MQIIPDGAGPFGDPYQVDSANNGPYGEALTQEVIPFIEKTYRCIGRPEARFTTGGSTGGWVSLALQIFYPDYFNGCWSQCPDSVTFERFELIDLYGEPNAYANRFGFERPSTRTIDGDTVSTVRHECQLERVLGRGGRWELSGRDWASWNSVYGPRGTDGLPVPVWNGKTGEIDKTVVEHWKKYDLKLYLEKNWSTLGPRLTGKINVWVGDSDDYFLNVAVRRFKDSMDQRTNPRFDGRILIEPRAATHPAAGRGRRCSTGWQTAWQIAFGNGRSKCSYSAPSPLSNSGSSSSKTFPVLRLCAMRQTEPNAHVSVQVSDRGASGKSPARMCATIRATQSSSCLLNLGHASASATHASAELRPAGRTGFAPVSVTSQYARPRGRAGRSFRRTRSTASA